MDTIATKTDDVPVGTIVVGVDDAASATEALEWAVTEAKTTGRAITLIHVIAEIDPHQAVWLAKAGVSSRSLLRAESKAARERLEALAEKQRSIGVTVHVAVGVGNARYELPAMASSAHRLVVGSHGRGPVMSRLLGSVGIAVVRHANCPIVVVRPPTGASTTPGIVVSANGAAGGQAALEIAFLEAESHQCPLTVVACDPDGEAASGHWSVPTSRGERDAARLAIAEAVAGLREDHPDVAVSTFVAEGSLLHCLLDLGGRREEIVIDRAVDGAERGHFGAAASLAAAVVEHASTTVIVVP